MQAYLFSAVNSLGQRLYADPTLTQQTRYVDPTLVYCLLVYCLLLARALRRWPNSKPMLGQRLIFAGKPNMAQV